jgi:unsaturated chondroitin disaccharide hydrolase
MRTLQTAVFTVSLAALFAWACGGGEGGRDGDADAAEPEAETEDAGTDDGTLEDVAAEDALDVVDAADREDETGSCAPEKTACPGGGCAHLLGQLAGTAGWLHVPQYPVRTSSYDAWVTSDAAGWTSGFFPGCLWFMAEMTGETDWLSLAETWTAGLEGQKNDTTSHDVGFQIMNSFGQGYRLTGDAGYRDVVLEAAQSLATRFNAAVGCTRSWSWGSWSFPVIIDNMMNLEILFWASANGGPAELYDMAASHAAVTMDSHVRSDGSTWHVVEFDPDSGDVVERTTWQGYAPESTWARGQAWALYGFTMTFRETGDTVFLDTARRTADFFIDHLPEDHVPYWDFDAPGIPDTERDSSAAAIAASGLCELSTLTDDETEQSRYYEAALDILASLCTPVASGGYLAEDDRGYPVSPGILVQGCQVHPDSAAGADQCDESLIFGDYYFIEALMRYRAMEAP